VEEDLRPAAGSSWPQADRIAATFLHLGNPEAARRLWAEAADPPSPALRLTRTAGADLAAFDSAAAESRCREALKLDPRLGEAWYVLSVALFEGGRADDALNACRESVRHALTSAQRERILGLETLLGRRR
jgi:cytochrome c-type biogenesis protein CcmH/NrfG